MLSRVKPTVLTAVLASGLLGLSAMAATSAGATQTQGPTAPTNLTGNLEFGPGECSTWTTRADNLIPARSRVPERTREPPL
jgi:hypothetical protein